MNTMSLFDFDDYKAFINAWIRSKEKNGHGQFQRISEALSIHPTLVSHVFRGKKDLSLEQATALCRYLEFSPLETDYFLMLVQKAKSGSIELSRVLERQITDLQRRARSLVNRVAREAELTEEDKAIFYSNWYYSAIRLLTSIPGFSTTATVQRHLGLSTALVQEVLDFLTQKGLCHFDGKEYSLGPAITHLEAASKFVSRHHTNWRLRAIENHPKLADEDLLFTGPLTISKNDAAAIREKIVRFIQELGRIVKKSPSEELYCFNVDWVKVVQSKVQSS